MTLTRRSFLGAGVAVTTGAALSALPTPALATPESLPRPDSIRPVHAAPLPKQSPFCLGVASGDPDPSSVVLWTRLALDPLAPDGRGGMAAHPYPLHWEVAADPRFRRIAARGTAVARPEFAHAVHVTPRGLRPGREYWYRFRLGRHFSPVGRTMTAPAAHETPAALAMSFASCSQFEHGWFTAYRRLAEDQPDLVLHLGDYQYEYTKQTYLAASGNVRDHDGPETTTLEGYRQRYAQYHADADLQAAHAAAPWLLVFDDHEVDNNWADDDSEHPEESPLLMERRAAAFRAYYENMPLRPTSIPDGPFLQLFRTVRWGRLANFHMMDTRQYRDDQACGDGYDRDCPAASDPNRTITGARQERWLLDEFAHSRARWDILGQQVFFAQRDSQASAGLTVSMDAWDGYAASRQRVTDGWVRAGVRNPVVLTGDVHAHWACDLKADYNVPGSTTVGTELVTSSITSGGDGADSVTGSHPWQAYNPHIRFYNNLRGYVRTTISRHAMDADFRCVPKVSEPDQPAFTRISYRIHDRRPGLDLIADHGPAARVGAQSRTGTPNRRDSQNRRGTQGASGPDTERAETQRP